MGQCTLSLGAWAYVLAEPLCMGLCALSLNACANVRRVSVHGPMCSESQSMGQCALSLSAWANVLNDDYSDYND